MSKPLVIIPVGVVVERLKAQSPWIDHIWQPANVLEGVPDMQPWTLLEGNSDRALFYAGRAEIGLHAGDAAHYRENLVTGYPKLWIILRPTGVEPPLELVMVTADPFEGEGLTESATDLVEPVPMPESIQGVLMAFIDEHYVDEPFFKRKRDKANPEAFARRPGGLTEKKT
ncbi:MAG: DUF3305 domain-containing protein [Xanthobacteraceae bacterium]|nr:DUF3305 domain-containing protein [Xanthobacteraceae bacterium]